MATSTTGSNRSSLLDKYWKQVLEGQRTLKTSKDAKLFIEAMSNQPNHQDCIERLIASAPGMQALHSAVRYDVSVASLNRDLTSLLHYLADPNVQKLYNGECLTKILLLLVDPPGLWKSLLSAFMSRALEPQAIEAFAWLLLELCSTASSMREEFLRDAQTVLDDNFLLQSSAHAARTLAYKIKNVVQTRSVASFDAEGLDDVPGGRHDNDYSDFRQIAIYPTADELRSDEKPFYRRAETITAAKPEDRAAMHLDNQFRLLREDMLAELREDLNINQGQKRNKRPVKILRSLTLVGIFTGDENKRRPVALAIECRMGLEQLTAVRQDRRTAFLSENPKYMRHQSSGCLLLNGEIVAFATIDRQPSGLIKDPPVVMLEIMGDEPFQKTLFRFKESANLQFCFVDTSFFAYEPVLRCLQEKAGFPLAEDLLQPHTSDASRQPSIIPEHVIKDLESKNDQNVQDVFRTDKKIILDPSQLESLLSGLTQTVSLIQGPPGK